MMSSWERMSGRLVLLSSKVGKGIVWPNGDVNVRAATEWTHRACLRAFSCSTMMQWLSQIMLINRILQSAVVVIETGVVC